jgi:hypothetical protein
MRFESLVCVFDVFIGAYYVPCSSMHVLIKLIWFFTFSLLLCLEERNTYATIA